MREIEIGCISTPNQTATASFHVTRAIPACPNPHLTHLLHAQFLLEHFTPVVQFGKRVDPVLVFLCDLGVGRLGLFLFRELDWLVGQSDGQGRVHPRMLNLPLFWTAFSIA